MCKVNAEELNKKLEELVRKSVLIILNARIFTQVKTSTNAKEDTKLNSKFLTNEPESIDLDDLFLDEYQELKSSKFEKVYFLEIYFKRKEVKLLIERWKFNFKNECTNKKIMDSFVKNKLNILIRTIYTITRLLPGFTFHQKSGFNFSLDYKFYTDLSKQDSFLSNTMTMNLNYIRALNDFSLEIEYLDKNEIFKLENDSKKIVNDHVVFRRPRFLSEDTTNYKVTIPSFEILNFEDTSIEDNYFSKNPENNKTRIKRVVSEEVIAKNLIIEEHLKSYIDQGHLTLSDSISSSTNNELENKLQNDLDTFLSYKKDLKRLHSLQNKFKNFKTSDTSSCIESSSESFELEFEDELSNHSEYMNINEIEEEKLDLSINHNFKIEEIFRKLKNLKKELKVGKNRSIHFNFINFYKTYDKLFINQKR